MRGSMTSMGISVSSSSLKYLFLLYVVRYFTCKTVCAPHVCSDRGGQKGHSIAGNSCLAL